MSFLNTKNGELCARIKILFKSEWIIWLIILYGITLRLHQYLFNRSFWHDEAAIALNIMDRSFLTLLQPLDYDQGAPLGFLLIEKFISMAMGNTEYVFRIFPFFCGILSLLIFYKLMKTITEGKAVLIAIALFAISDPLIYYSSELKQYSCDLTIALLLYLLFIQLISEELSTKKIIYYSMIGIVAIWISHPAVFVLAGIGSNSYIVSFIKKDLSKIKKLSIIFGILGLFFLSFYLVLLDDLIQNKFLTNYWKDYFMPLPPMSLSDLRWYPDKFFELFEYPVGIPFKGLAAFAFLVGCYSMLQKNKEIFGMLVLPLIFVAIASSLHLYPMGRRLILFAVPNFIIFIAEGIEYIASKIRQKSVEVRFLLLLLLFFYPSLFSLYHLLKPRTTEELRPTLEFIHQKMSDNDAIYLTRRTQRTFQYYRRKYDFERTTIIDASASPQQYDQFTKEIDNLRNFKRTWVVWTRSTMNVINRDDILFSYLDEVGNKVESFSGNRNSGANLYEFNRPQRE